MAFFLALPVYLKKKKKQKQNNDITAQQISYFDKFLKDGTITQEEYWAKVEEIKNSNQKNMMGENIMNNISSKHLSIVAVLIAVVYLINTIFYASYGVVTIVSNILAVVLESILAYAMYREKNDTFTKVIVILFAIINLNIYVGLIVVLMLIKKNAITETIVSKLWWIPAALASIILLISLISNIGYYNGQVFLPIVTYIANVINYAVLGYWLVYKLDINTKNEINRKNDAEIVARQIAYFDDLLKNGIINQGEYNEKVRQIQTK